MTRTERQRLSENPKYQIGDVIQINVGYQTGPGLKDLKPGKYQVLGFRRSVMRIDYDMVYEFKSVRSNSTYNFVYSQTFIENNSNKV